MTAMLGPHRKAKGKTDSWLTPRWLIETLGPFDTDPCCPPTMPWKTAAVMIHHPEDGLCAPWEGRVWLNPPYGKGIDVWLRRLALHGDGIALVFARTGTRWAQSAFASACAVLFIAGRLTFCDEAGKPAPSPAGCDSMLLAYGEATATRLGVSGIEGRFMKLCSFSSKI